MASTGGQTRGKMTSMEHRRGSWLRNQVSESQPGPAASKGLCHWSGLLEWSSKPGDVGTYRPASHSEFSTPPQASWLAVRRGLPILAGGLCVPAVCL